MFHCPRELSLVRVTQKSVAPINGRLHKDAIFITFIELVFEVFTSLKYSQVGNLDKKLGWWSLARCAASFLRPETTGVLQKHMI